MLFSEPKIPQSASGLTHDKVRYRFQCSSASRKFLNSDPPTHAPSQPKFQCSSASRKFLNQYDIGLAIRVLNVSVLFSEPKIPQFCRTVIAAVAAMRFSALQRAENSSITKEAQDEHHHFVFQCSSASRKFLNASVIGVMVRGCRVSVLFSEPKIPQCSAVC